MNSLFEKLGYNFKNVQYIETALTHSSYANEMKKNRECNERLEFLGDSVLSIVVADYLFKNCSHLPEGDMTKLRAALVCEQALFDYATKINLGFYLKLGKGEIMTGGRERPSILADAFEAVIAAIYLDGGMEKASSFILKFIKERIKTAGAETAKDYKTILQEIIQQNKEEKVTYHLVSESGPDHDKHFFVEVHLNSNVIGKGEGKSKKQAEQLAAKEALELMGER